MRHVIYSDFDMEPITIVEVNDFLMGMIRDGNYVAIAVEEEPKFRIPSNEVIKPIRFRKVYLFGERLIRRGHEHWMIFTRDEELALLLRSAYLPGQLGDIARMRKEAFIHGMVEGIRRAYGE